MSFEKSQLDDIYQLKEEEKFTEASQVPLRWFSPFDKEKINIINLDNNNEHHFMRLSLKTQKQ